jgi:putative solute:sodium symporter small subunit
MTDKTSHESTDDTVVETDGGTESGTPSEVRSDGGTVSGAAQRHRDTDYLDKKVNLLKPSTAFMRDHLKLVWGSFLVWILTTWGPVVATYFAPSTMTSITVLGFPAHYFLVAFFAPTSSLVLAAIYARQRDKLDEKYGINTSSPAETTSADATAADGGVEQ